MRRIGMVSAFLLAATSTVAQQSVQLQLDPDPGNSCEKAGNGAAWVLYYPALPTYDYRVVQAVVSLRRIENAGLPPRVVSYTISSGQKIQLDCSQGHPQVSYQIVDQK